MRQRIVISLFLSIFINIHPIKAKARAAAKNDLIAAVVNPKIDGEIATVAESDGEIATVVEDGVRLASMERKLQHDSLISNSDSQLKHELERSADGVGRTRRSCGTGCGGCGCGGGCGGCGGCGCGCGCGCSCCQKSCCCSTCTVTTTCCKKCCCQSCCGCGNCGGDCGGGGCGGGGGGGGGRKKREFAELLEERSLREKRSPRSSRRRVTNDVLTNKTAKVPIDMINFW